MAHQWRSQIEDAGVRAAPMATGNKLIFQVTPEDATAFARMFSRAVPVRALHLPPPAPEPPEYLRQMTRRGREKIDAVAQSSRPETGREEFAAAWEELKDQIQHRQRDTELMRFVDDYFIACNQHDGRLHSTMAAMTEYVLNTPQGVALWSQVFRDPQGDRHDRSQLRTSYSHLMGERFLGNTDYETRAAFDARVKEKVREHMKADWERQRRRTPRNFLHAVSMCGILLWKHPVDLMESVSNPLYKEWANQEFARQRLVREGEGASTQAIAKTLTDLPKYYAHSKLSQGNFSVEMTIAVERIDPPAISYEAEIRERCRRLYCVTMEEAMAMIVARQTEEQPPGDDQRFFDPPPKRGGV